MFNILIIVMYFVSANYSSAISKLSIKELISGPTAVPFWLGVIVVGLLIPLFVDLMSMVTGSEVSSALLIFAITCHTLGAFALKYCLLKVGIYRPLLPRLAAY